MQTTDSSTSTPVASIEGEVSYVLPPLPLLHASSDSEVQAKRRASCERRNTHRLRKIFEWYRPDAPVAGHHFGGDLGEKASETSDNASSTSTSRASASDCSSLADHERAASWGPFLAEQDGSGQQAEAEAEELPIDVTS